MLRSPLADALEEAVHPWMAALEAEVLAKTGDASAARQTMERVPPLVRELVARLRNDTEYREAPPRLQSARDMDQRVSAARLVKSAVWDAIEQQLLPATPRDLRTVAEWCEDKIARELRAGYQRLSDTLDAVPDHVMVMGLDRVYRYFSRHAALTLSEVLGVKPTEMIGRSVDEIIAASPEPVRPAIERHVAEIIERARHGEGMREELLLPAGNGLHWRERHAGPIRGPDGEVDAIAIASRDINDRKKAEARLQILSKLGALAETTEHESIVDAIAHLSIPELADSCLINVLDRDGEAPRTTLAHRDPAKARLVAELLRLPSQLPDLRVGESALAGQSTLIVDLTDTNVEGALRRSEIVQRLGVRSAMVVPIVVMKATIAIATFMMTPDSGRRYAAQDLALAQEMCRRAAQMIENAQLHQQLQQSEARFRVALDHASISVFETDADLRLRWNHNSMLGVAAGELTGELPRRVMATGEGARGAFSAVIDGRRRHFMVRYEPLRSAEGIVGVSGATIDVTEIKEAEEKLANELAFRERMIGILGHDLRNPVSAVLGLASLMQSGELTERARKQLHFLEQAARRMNEMIATLLDFTRLRFHGSLPIAIARVGLDELARELVEELRAAHRGREIELLTSGNLRGEWDPGRMAQLFTNLVTNGLTHGEKGSPVWIDVSDAGDDVVLSVSNRGGAIAPAVGDRLFEPFRQGNDADGGGRRGLGLGLFIVREIVRAHRGTICLRSGEGRITFTANLPRRASPDTATDQRERS